MATRSLRRPPPPSDEPGESVSRTTGARPPLLALCAATLALLAAIVVAAGPARGESAEYSWPPPTLPAERPERGFYTPLPLLNRVPSSIELTLSCGLAPALRDSRRMIVLATARRTETAGALRVVRVGDALRISVDASSAELPWPASCPLRVEVADGELRLPGRAVRLRTGTLENMPIVTGLFTGLDLRFGEPPHVVVRTRDYATSWTARQLVAGALAVALAFAALILLARPRRRRLLGSVRRGIRSAWEARDRTDAAVVGVLLVWWIVAPTLFDDGWLWVELRAFDDLGTLNFYYDTWGVTSPLGYWLVWLDHWAIGSTSDLVFMRVPTLLALLASWPLCRWCLHRVASGPESASVRWTLAGAFLVGATAWGMTLRLEPFVSVLVLVSLAAMISFALAPRLAPLAIAVPAVVLAVTAHPAGFVAAAPLLAGAPQAMGWLWRGGRPLLLAFGALLLAGLALALVVFTLDADLATRLSEARVAGGGDYHHQPWWREYVRYTTFDVEGGGTAIRRLSLAFILLSVLAWLTHRRAVRTGMLVLPARSVAVALVLLAFVPSKWPWHFGALAGMGAVATAAEFARLLRERDQPGWRTIRPVFALAAVGALTLWSWRAPGGWGLVDLQETSWRSGFNGYSFLALVAIFVAAAAFSVRTGRKRVSVEAIVGRAIAIVSFAVVGLTAAILVRDATVTAWSPPRQNLEAIVGRSSCGLAHQLRGEGDVSELLADPETPVLLEPPVAVYFPCATIPALEDGLVQVPMLVVFRSGLWPLEEKDGPFAAVPDLYGLRTIARGPRGVEVLSVADDVPGFIRIDAIRGDPTSRTTG